MSHIQLNYAIRLFWRIFGLIHWKLLFLFQKVTISERSTEILRKFVFLTSLKREKHEENLDLFKQLILIKPVKEDNINKICFFPQNEPHTVKLCFPVVLKYFLGNSLKTSLLSQKSDYLRKKLRNTWKVCFSQQVWKGGNSVENLNLL